MKNNNEKGVQVKKRQLAKKLSEKYKKWLLEQSIKDIEFENSFSIWAKI